LTSTIYHEEGSTIDTTFEASSEGIPDVSDRNIYTNSFYLTPELGDGKGQPTTEGNDIHRGIERLGSGYL
jgi:hypothetical protein